MEILKELDKSLEKQCKVLSKTNWFKRHVCINRLRDALVHVKRELRKVER